MRPLRSRIYPELGELADVWKRFARWGELIEEASRRVCLFDEDSADWNPVRRILQSFDQLIQHERRRIEGLLIRSDALFNPLVDPLRLPFDSHRWFDPERAREESYSDWLEWLIAQLDSGQVLQLFSLEHTEFGTAVLTRRAVEISREKSIQGLSGAGKRLDLVLEFDGDAILLVEIKIHNLDEAGGRDNLPVYMKWLEERQPDPKLRAAVLVLPNQDESAPTDWTSRLWGDIALVFRRLVLGMLNAKPDDGQPSGLLRSAMILAFTGAIEQNLLGLSASKSAVTVPQTTLHLERFLQECEQ
jgi:hypothetical protein